MGDHYANLTVVGSGPAFRRAGDIPKKRLAEILALDAGDSVDVLLDDGRIVRVVMRHRATRAGSHWSVWLTGVVGSYSAGRARIVGGWSRTPGCRYGEVPRG